MNSLNPPRGMRDFLPAQKTIREKVLKTVRETYRKYGFDEIETPALEEIDRLVASDGGENQKMIFTTLRRRLQPAEIIDAANTPNDLVDLGLRYDLTVPLARFYATHRSELSKVFRAIQIGPVWRAERPQRGRYRQFLQCDIDIVGEAGNLAEAELFQATGDVLDRLGVAGWGIRVNSRKLLDSVMEACGISGSQRAAVYIIIDKFDKIGADGVKTELAGLELGAVSRERLWAYLQTVTEIQAAADVSTAFEVFEKMNAMPVTNDLRELIAVLPENLVAKLVFDPLLIRGMGYYTGLVYEIQALGSAISIGGGGRYDSMVERLTGTPAPAVGMSLGFERLIDLVSGDQTAADPGVVVVYDRDVPTARLLRVKEELINKGWRVRLEQRPRQVPQLLNRLRQEGYTAFAVLRADKPEVHVKTLVE